MGETLKKRPNSVEKGRPHTAASNFAQLDLPSLWGHFPQGEKGTRPAGYRVPFFVLSKHGTRDHDQDGWRFVAVL